MKKLLGLSLLSLGVAAVLFVTNLWPRTNGASVAEAAATSVTVVDQQCLSATQVRINLAWVGYNEGSQWIDLSLTNNGFVPGTFVGVGPAPSYQTNFTWDGLLPGLTHFLRVNTLTNAGWSTSPTISFTTRNDCQFIPQVSLGVGASNLTVNQVCMPNGAPRLSLLWSSSNQGQQYLDNSTYSPNFEPGTFPSVGPFATNQTTYDWDGLAPGSLHYIRINTGTPYGWIGSGAVTTYVRADCQAAVPTATATVAATATKPPTTPTVVN